MNPLVEQLGWALAHSLWQFAFVALLASGIVRALRRIRAATRYGVLVVALAVSVVAPLATWCLRSNPAAAGAPRPAQVPPKRSPNPLKAVLQPVAANARLDLAGDEMPVGMVQRLGSTRFKAPRYQRLAFAGNDEWVWLAAENRVSVMHRETGRVIRHHQLRLGEDNAWSLTTSADGTQVAIGMSDMPPDADKQINYRVVVMSALTTAHLHELTWKGPMSVLTCLSISDDGQTMLTGTQAGDVRLWNVETGKLLSQRAFNDADLRGGAMSPDGRSAVPGGPRGVFLWKHAENVAPIKLQTPRGDSVRFAPNGRVFATMEPDGARLWDATTGVSVAHLKTEEIQNYSGADFGIAFTPDSKVLAVPVRLRNLIELWDVESKQRLATLEPIRGPRGVAISRDGRWLAASGDDDVTTIFDLQTRQPVKPSEGHAHGVHGVRFADADSLVTSSFRDARVWDIATGKQQQLLGYPEPRGAEGLATSPDGRTIVTNSHDNTLGVWDRATGKRLFTLKGHGHLGKSRAVRFTADGSQFVSWGDDDKFLRWWNPKDGSLIAAHALDVPELAGVPAALAPDANSLITTFKDDLFEFETRKGQLLREAKTNREIDVLAISPDGRWLAAAEWQRAANRNPISKSIVLRDRATLKIVREWLVSDPREAINAVPAAGNDAPANDAPPKPPTRMTYGPHTEHGLVFSPDSKRLAWTRTGTRHGIDIADVTSDRLFASIPVESRCSCLEFSPDGTRIASGHADSTASVWDLKHPAFAVAEVKGLEFLKPYPKLHGLSLDMTEPQFLEIVKQQELKTRKTVDGKKVTHHIPLGDDHTLIVMFDKDAKCSGIQRVRGEDREPIRVMLKLNRKEFLLGESIAVEYEMTNDGNADAPYGKGGFYPDLRINDGFRMSAVKVDENGKPVAEPVGNWPMPENFGGPVGGFKLKPGEKYSTTLFVTRYLRWLEPGRYRLRVENVDRLERDPASAYSTGETYLTLKQPTPEEARGVFERMKKAPRQAYDDNAMTFLPEAADFQAMHQPIYLPILKEFAAKSDRDALQSLQRMERIEANEVLVATMAGALDRDDWRTARVCFQHLKTSLPFPNWFNKPLGEYDQPNRDRVARLWQPAFVPTLTRLAKRLNVQVTSLMRERKSQPLDADANDREFLKVFRNGFFPPEHPQSLLVDLDFIYRCVGQPEDFSDCLAAYAHSIELTKTLPLETNQYFRPRGSASGFGHTVMYLLRRGAKAPNQPAHPGEAAAFAIALRTQDGFRPAGWQAEVMKWLKHDSPYLTELILGCLPDPVPNEVFEYLPTALAHDYIDLQIAACHVAKTHPRPAYREPLQKILDTAKDPYLRKYAVDAARANGLKAKYDPDAPFVDQATENADPSETDKRDDAGAQATDPPLEFRFAANPADRPQTAVGSEPKLGTLSGRFLFDGEPPVPQDLFPTLAGPMNPGPDGRYSGVQGVYHDFLRLKIRPSTMAPSLLVSKDGGIANVIVWVVSKDIPWIAPQDGLKAATIRVKDGNYSPRITAVTIGQPLQLENHDPISFNFHLSAVRNDPVNMVLHAASSNHPERLTFRMSEKLPVMFRSDQGIWATGVLLVRDNPFVAISQPDGSFSMPNLPPGEWEFRAWHERKGYVQHWPKGLFKLAIKPGENRLGTIKLKPEFFFRAP